MFNAYICKIMHTTFYAIYSAIIRLCTSITLTTGSFIAETKETMEITDKSDIYGFGLIIIELLTGRSPADAEFGVEKSFVEWARYCYSDCHLHMWVDSMVKTHASLNQNEVVELMNLALQCTASDPTARPCANDVTRTLESIMRSSTSSCALALEYYSST